MAEGLDAAQLVGQLDRLCDPQEGTGVPNGVPVVVVLARGAQMVAEGLDGHRYRVTSVEYDHRSGELEVRCGG